MPPLHVRAGDASANMSSSDSDALRDSGDLLNGIGSTSSLASTVSSSHAAASNASSSAANAALTPLTHPASTPVKAYSPHTASKPYLMSTVSNPSPLGLSAGDADTPPALSDNVTPRPSPPNQRPQLMPPSGKAKGYRAVYDPELDSKLGREEKKRTKVKTRSFGTESHQNTPPPDPRLAISGYTSGKAVPPTAQSKTKCRLAPYVLKPYAFDQKTSIGPGPAKQIVVHGFDPIMPAARLKSFFSSFGDISEFRIQTDPNTGSPLGICLIKFKDSKPVKGVSTSAANAAKRAEKEGHNERIGLNQVKVERDREGRRCRRYVEIRLKRARQVMEKQAAQSARSVVAETVDSPTPIPAPPPPPPVDSEEPPAIPVNAPRGPASKKEKGAPAEQPAASKERDSGRPVIESESILGKIKRKPYIFLPNESVPVLISTVPHLKRRFKAYDWREIRADKTGYFIVFEDSKRGEDETVRCFKECNNGPMFTYTMAMECQQYGNPNYERSPSPETQAVLQREKDKNERLEKWNAEDLEEEKKERAADLDPVKGALEKLRVELRDKIMDDIKGRIVIPTLYDCLDPVRHAAKRRKLDLPEPVDNENRLPAVLLNKASQPRSESTRTRNGRPLSHSKPLRPHDPNRGRGTASAPSNAYLDERRQQRPGPRSAAVPARSLLSRLQQLHADDNDEGDGDSEDERRTSMTRDTEDQESRPLSRASRTSTPFSVSESVDNHNVTPPRKKRKLVHKEAVWESGEEQETFAPYQKELLGDLLQKVPETMAIRELELIRSTLPRDSKFRQRAQDVLFAQLRAKNPTPAAENAQSAEHASEMDRSGSIAESGDLPAKPVKKTLKRIRKSKKQLSEEREALRAAASAAENTQTMDDAAAGLAEENEADVDVAEEVIEEEEEEQQTKPQVEWAVSSDKPRRTVEDDEAFFDIDGWKYVVKDEEDMRYLDKALETEAAADIGDDAALWTWKQNEIKSVNVNDTYGHVMIPGHYKPNPTGCARTEGYQKIAESEKSKYLPHRLKVFNERLEREARAKDNPNAAAAEATKAAEAAKAAAAAKITSTVSSRSNRANNRRLVNEITLSKANLSTAGNETDAIKFNALVKRKKHVKFDRSAIHGWGLYALENIALNDLIIEYVGEKVRQQVADLREQKYTKQGIGSSYLFKLVDDEIVDATKMGGIARFINHSCTPNCTAKIIKVDGTRRIVIYALKDIAKNQELTYDYKFEREFGSTDRIPCLCGSVGCKGYLN